MNLSNRFDALPLAITGIGLRLPGAHSLESYWDLLRSGRHAIAPLPASRLSRERYYQPGAACPGKTYSQIGGTVPDEDLDPHSLSLSESELRSADPAHLWFLHTALAALRHAKIDPESLAGQRMGVFVGHARGSTLAADLTYSASIESLVAALLSAPELQALPAALREQLSDRLVQDTHARYPSLHEDGGPFFQPSAAAALTARRLKLTGPYVAIDAACASSFAALDIAARAIHAGEIEAAIVGGCSYNQWSSLVLFSQAQALSPNGSFPFDERADGFVSSDGHAAILLEPLARARAAGRVPLAILRSIGGSCDGRGKSLWAPLKEGQIEAITRAYREGLGPDSVQVIEAHATGTAVGDATEISALAAVYGQGADGDGRRRPISSVKANIGHTRETAGMAGLIKMILALNEGVVPPAASLEVPSSRIDWAEVPFRLPRAAEPWPDEPGRPRRGAVNAFGIGGLNYHVVLEQPGPELAGPDVRITETAREPIALVGIGAVLPGAQDLAGLLALAARPPQPTRPEPSRWEPELYCDAAGGPYRIRQASGHFLRGWQFDWRRHKIPPKQVEGSDPLQFMLLEAAAQALHHAGWPQEAPPLALRTAVYVGSVFGGDFTSRLNIGMRLPELEEDLRALLLAQGQTPAAVSDLVAAGRRTALQRFPIDDQAGSFSSSTLASRIAKHFDLSGPCCALDAEEASGLVALASAMAALRANTCDVVLCCAGQRLMHHTRFAHYERLGKLAQPDRGGFLLAEGAVALTLRRLSDAEREGQPILAVLHEAIGASSPDGPWPALREAVRRASERTPLRPRLVECFAQGVPGDEAAERESLRAGYSQQPGGAAPQLTSATPGLGMAQGASGLVGLVHLAVTAAAPANTRTPAALDSIGLRGLAYHALLEVGSLGPAVTATPPAPRLASPQRSDDSLHGVRIIRLWAPSREDLRKQIAASDPERLWEAAAAARSFPADATWRLAVVASSAAALRTKLVIAREASEQPAAWPALHEQGVFFHHRPASPPELALVFSGQGSQYGGMLKELCQLFPETRPVLAEIDQVLAELGEPSFADVIWQPEREAQLGTDTWLTQLAVLGADLLMNSVLAPMRLRPSLVLGHSYGEYPALCAAGAWSLRTALLATHARCRALGELGPPPGRLISTNASAEQEAALKQRFADRGFVAAANYNSPEQLVLAVENAVVDEVLGALGESGVVAQLLPVPQPYHSQLLAPAQPGLERALATLPLRPPRTPLLSGVGNTYAADPDDIRRRLVAQLTEPLRFTELVRRAWADGIRVFIEVGPRTVLTRLIRSTLAGEPVLALCTDHPKVPAAEQLARVRALLETQDLWQPAERSAPQAVPDGRLPRIVPYARTRQLPEPADLPIPHFDATAKRRSKLQNQASAPSREPEAEEAQTDHSGAQSTAAGEPLGEMERFLINFVCEQTGYPPEVVGLDQDLEADLGIDSIKRAQMLGELKDQFRLKLPVSGSGGLSLAKLVTLRDVSRLLKEYAPDAAAAPRTTTANVAAAPTEKPAAEPGPAPAGILKLHRFSGSRFELGRQHGAAFAAEIERGLRRYRDLLGENVLELEPVKAFLARQHEFFDEASLEELRGIAEGSGLPFQRIVAYNLGLEPEHGLFGCSQLAIRAAANGGAGLLHAANEDSPIALRLGNQLGRFVQVRQPARDGSRARHAVCVFSSPGQIGGINGLSASGLVVSSTMLLDQPRDLTAVGAVHPCLVLRILEEADDPDQAVAIVQKWPRVGAWSLLISHAPTDRIVYLEYDGARLVSEDVTGAVFTTNHSRLLGAGAPPEHSLHRLARLSTLSAASPLRVEAVQAMLRDRTDLGRGRVVTHCTMNTVCRVDNQLSFVYSAAAGAAQLWATPGPERGELADRFDALPPADLFGAASERAPVSDAAVPESSRLMHRFILRTEAEPAAPGSSAPVAPRRTLIVSGSGATELAELVQRALVESGSEVRTIAEPDPITLAFGAWLPQRLILLTALDGSPLPEGGAQERAAWLHRNGSVILGLAQRWVAALRSAGSLDGAELVALTAMGGDLGFGASRESLPAGGALSGLLKALRRELPELRLKLVDTPVGEPPALRCRSLLHELAALSAGGPLEVGVVRGRRQRVRMIRRELPEPIASSATRGPAQALTPQAAWLVTGGGRGITSLCARALGERFGVSLHLVGSTPHEEVPDAWFALDAAGLRGLRQEILAEARQKGRPPQDAWREVERRIALATTLKQLAAAGLRFRYHQADLGDEAALQRVLAAVRKDGVPLRGILHGAGTESASELAKKTEAGVRAALHSKVLGLLHLLALTAADPIEMIVGFGSVSGRFGGLGQADYSLASDLLAKVLGAHRRATGIASTTFAWPAWGDVGMAMRPESRIALESVGQAFMPAAEGIEHLVRELAAGLPESEIVLLDRPELMDADRTAIAGAEHAPLQQANTRAAEWAILDGVLDVRPGSVVAECLFDPRRDVFLLEHQFEGAPILPAVIGLEALAEAALLGVAPQTAFTLEEARIHAGLRFQGSSPRPLRAQVTVQAAAQGHYVARLLADHLSRSGGLSEPGRLYVAAKLSTAPIGRAPDEIAPPPALAWQPMRYLDGPGAGTGAEARRVYHGPALRTLKQLCGDGQRAWAELLAPSAAESLRPERPDAHWRLPAALLDGCLVACGAFARAHLGLLSLPDGFERLTVHKLPQPGQRCRLQLELLRREELHLGFRFTLRDETGEPLLWAEGYRAVVVADLSTSSEGK